MKATQNISSQYIDQLLALKYMREGGMFLVLSRQEIKQSVSLSSLASFREFS